MVQNEDGWFDVAFGETEEVYDLIQRVAKGDSSVVLSLCDRVLHQGTLFSLAPLVVESLAEIALNNPRMLTEILPAISKIGISQPEWVVLLPPFGINNLRTPLAYFDYPSGSYDAQLASKCRLSAFDLCKYSLKFIDDDDDELRSAVLYGAFWHLYDDPDYLSGVIASGPECYFYREYIERMISGYFLGLEMSGIKHRLKPGVQSCFGQLMEGAPLPSIKKEAICDLLLGSDDVRWFEGRLELPILSMRSKLDSGYADFFSAALPIIFDNRSRIFSMIHLTTHLAQRGRICKNDLYSIISLIRNLDENYESEIDQINKVISGRQSKP